MKAPLTALPILLVSCSEYRVEDTDTPSQGAFAEILVTPSDLSFGAIPIGTVSAKTVEISNRGSASLDVSAITIGPNVAFGLGNTQVPAVLPPGGSVTVDVSYRGTTTSDTSWLGVSSSDPNSPFVEVGLTGAALLPELTINPDPLVFQGIEVGCQATAPVLLQNTGTAPLTVGGLLVTGSMFSIRAPVLEQPTLLPPGGSLTVDVAFSPAVLAHHTGVLAVDSDDPRATRTSALAGDVIVPRDVVDVFEQVPNDWSRIDVVFYVDQSGSMADDQENLADNFDVFLNLLQAEAVDFQIIVVTDDDGCHNEEILTSATIDPLAVFTTAVHGPHGQYLEAGLLLTSTALEETDPGECNDGFLRPGVETIGILVSDEPEQSPLGWSSSLDAILAKAPSAVLCAIVGQSDDGCAAGGTGYHEAAAATDGPDLDICATDWATYFADIVGEIDVPTTAFTLSATPDPASLSVTVGGAPAVGWTWNDAMNSVEFNEPAEIPPPGSSVMVTYAVASSCF